MDQLKLPASYDHDLSLLREEVKDIEKQVEISSRKGLRSIFKGILILVIAQVIKKAWFELSALVTCLENQSAPAGQQITLSEFHTLVEGSVKNGKLTSSQADEIKTTALIKAPCAENFDAGLLQQTRYRVTGAAWKHLDGDLTSKILD